LSATMANTNTVAAEGLVVRPSRASDGAFLHSLYTVGAARSAMD
jgi:hypothetical protein